jgi:hypothetical protein
MTRKKQPSFYSQIIGPRTIIWAALLFLFSIPAAFPVELEVIASDTGVYPDEENATIMIYMKNYSDTVAGFELWLLLDRPDLMEFSTDSITVADTTFWRCLQWSGPDCIDSLDITDSVLLDPGTEYDFITVHEYEVLAGAVDTSGTLTSGWEYISARSLGIGYDLKIVGLADLFPPPYTPGIGYPQLGDVPLIKVRLDIYDIPDTLQDRTAQIYIMANNLDNFFFSNEQGMGICVKTDTVYEDRCFTCLAWVGEICLQYMEFPCDSTFPLDSLYSDTTYFATLDPDCVIIQDGSVTILQGRCGDVDDNSTINILDITRLINFIYLSGPAPVYMQNADVDKTCAVNILDITSLINYIYRSGSPPECPPSWPCR